jgi:hypothetical protein
LIQWARGDAANTLSTSAIARDLEKVCCQRYLAANVHQACDAETMLIFRFESALFGTFLEPWWRAN